MYTVSSNITTLLFQKRLDDREEQDWYNLSYYCYNSSLVVKPKRGTAVMWYNHFVDEKVSVS